MTIFLSGVGLILFYSLVTNYDKFANIFSQISGIFFPFVLGFVIAYLLCPIYNFTVRKTYKCMEKIIEKGSSRLKFARVIATVISVGFLIIVLGGLFWMVIPELIQSIIGIVEILPRRVNDLIAYTSQLMDDGKYAFVEKTLKDLLENLKHYVSDLGSGNVVEILGTYLQKISEGVFVTLRTILDLLVAIIVAVYLLNGKEDFRAQIKKFINATLRKEQVDSLMEFAYFTDKTFGGFINGKIIDSFIIGVLCFFLMTIIGIPYSILISAIVGITNVIPFFGPFVGAIPSLIILLTVSPMDALYFAIMILGLQQLDGNVIGPKILGESIGLPSFWVMFAIIIGGGVFGFMGMILGVPVFAIIYYYLRKYIDKKLAAKNLPVDKASYQDFNKYDINRKELE